jgi:ubiquinone/menaquinone biosynthesis C-methylase UbiE
MGGYLEQNLSHPSPSQDLEDWHKRYKQQVQWTQHIRKYLFARINADQGRKVLEVGSGTGALLEEITQSKQYQITGIDISLPVLYFSKNILPSLQLAQANGIHLPFAEGTFIITICHYLLLWTKKPGMILSEMRRVTKSGGCIIALAEPDHQARIDYPPPLDQLGNLQTTSLEQQGVDSTIGRKLAGLFYKAGLSNILTGVLGAQWDFNSQQQFDTIEWKTITSDLGDKLPSEVLGEYKSLEEQSRKTGERTIFVPTFFAAGFVE